MKHFLSILFGFALLQNIAAQNTLRVIVKSDNEEEELLQGATAHVVDTTLAALADSNGLIVLENIPNGEQTIEFSNIGFFKKRVKITFPQKDILALLEVKLETQAEEMEEVIVTSTRNYQKAEYLPTRV